MDMNFEAVVLKTGHVVQPGDARTVPESLRVYGDADSLEQYHDNIRSVLEGAKVRTLDDMKTILEEAGYRVMRVTR